LIAKRCGHNDSENVKTCQCYDWVWFWRKHLPERKGQLCRVIARGKANSILIEFQDGKRFVVSRYAVRKR